MPQKRHYVALPVTERNSGEKQIHNNYLKCGNECMIIGIPCVFDLQPLIIGNRVNDMNRNHSDYLVFKAFPSQRNVEYKIIDDNE